jgi:hypothetical protein
MKSPFPGMDPFIEACGLWEDFHGHLIEHISLRLADDVPDRYIVRTGERSYFVLLESTGMTSRPFLPDVRVSTARTQPKAGKRKTATDGSAASGKVVLMRALIEDEHREAFVEIREADAEQRLVTCIEVLSPANKQPGSPGWEQYQRKRQSLMLGGVNLVEIDLLRGGQRMRMLDTWPNSPYTFLVARAHTGQLCRVWAASFQRRLPPIPVPLAKPDPEIPLDLQPMIASIYRRFRYSRSIDYNTPLTPALIDEEAAWVQKRLKSRQKPA